MSGKVPTTDRFGYNGLLPVTESVEIPSVWDVSRL